MKIELLKSDLQKLERKKALHSGEGSALDRGVNHAAIERSGILTS